MMLFVGERGTRLSGGQKQRVALAGIIASNPRFSFLNEATSMLDPKGRQEVLEAIHTLKQETKYDRAFNYP